MTDVMPFIIRQTDHSAERLHLVLGIDLSYKATDNWSPHSMRMVIYLVAQFVSVLSSTMPMLMQPASGSLESFQIIIYPPQSFNLALDGIRNLQDREKILPPVPASFWCGLEKQSSFFANG